MPAHPNDPPRRRRGLLMPQDATAVAMPAPRQRAPDQHSIRATPPLASTPWGDIPAPRIGREVANSRLGRLAGGALSLLGADTEAGPLGVIAGDAPRAGLLAVGGALGRGRHADEILRAAAETDRGVRHMLDRGAWDMVRSADQVGGGRVVYDILPANMEGLERSGRYIIDPRKATTDGPYSVQPKSGAKEIPAKKQEGVLYRGMSAEEFAEFQRTGEIKSAGDYNLTGQGGTTSFALDPQDAAGYAASPPNAFKPTFDRPAYVVAVRAPEAGAYKQVRGLDPTYEASITRPIRADEVVDVYRGDVYAISPGSQDLIQDHGQWRRSSARQAQSFVTWSKVGK
jgi:hypothetical protein